MAKKQAYGNESITTLKGAERVRKRPAVIFGSDGLDGCEHAVFEILSNAIDGMYRIYRSSTLSQCSRISWKWKSENLYLYDNTFI